MTREEAIEYLKRADITVGQKIKTKTAEALEMAIEALQTELCEDCISRQEVLHLPRRPLHNYWSETVGDVIYVEDIEELPSVQSEQKMGKWDYKTMNYPFYWECNICKHSFKTDFNYCPNCGAKMAESER